MTLEQIKIWYGLYEQYRNGWYLSANDWLELKRLNHLIMEASHKIHNDNMLGVKS